MLHALVTALALTSNTWTVDDNGPANFSQISAAIPLVAPGDILLVSPGNYAGFTPDKPLTILGKPGMPKPSINSLVTIPPIASFTLAGFQMVNLTVNHVPGRLAIDDCIIQGNTNGPALRIQNCPQALISRCTIFGATAGPVGMLGASCENSTVTFTACNIHGGNGQDFFNPPTTGGLGLSVNQGSYVIAVNTPISGGACGFNDNPNQATSGGGARAAIGSTLILRGLPTEGVGPGSWSPFGTPGTALEVSGGSTAVKSGIFVGSTVVFGGGVVISPTTPEPFMRVLGSDTPGQAREIDVFGPAAAPALLFGSLAPAILTAPQVEQKLWFDPSALIAVIPISTLGPTTALNIPVTIPTTAGIAGTTLELQTVFTTLHGNLQPSKLAATNAANLIVRF